MDVASIPGAQEGDVAELKSGDKSHKLLFQVKAIPQEVLDRIPTCQVSRGGGVDVMREEEGLNLTWYENTE